MLEHNKFMQANQKENKRYLGLKNPFILPAHRFHHAAFGDTKWQMACAGQNTASNLVPSSSGTQSCCVKMSVPCNGVRPASGFARQIEGQGSAQNIWIHWRAVGPSI